jgi:type I restriction enzyme S subunit
MVADLTEIELPAEAPTLPDGWRYELLGDLVDKRGVSYGIVQPGSEIGDGVPIVRVNNIRNGRVDTTDVLRVDPEIETKFSRSRLNGGEVLITLVGTLGEVAVAPDALRGWNVARAVGVIPVRPDPGSAWVSICLRSSFVQHCIRMWATTTVQATFNLRDLAKLPIPIPPKDTRDAIAAVLGALDDKIELNRRINATLEAMARAFFQSWFVDFDPVRAKLDGRQPTGLDPAAAALFPNEFEDSELGPIPRGWRGGKVSDMCSTQYGYTASAADEPIGPHFLRVMDINKQPWINWSSVPYCNISQDDKPRYALSVGDILVARMADPGKSAIVEQKVDAVFASYLVRLRTESLPQAYYLYYHLKSPAYGEYSAGAMGGSVQANMNAKVIVAAELLIPPVPIIKAFVEKILPLRQQIVANLDQSRSLAMIRDTLLPKLLSGEIRALT